jgi:hypothetical protein
LVRDKKPVWIAQPSQKLIVTGKQNAKTGKESSYQQKESIYKGKSRYYQ